MTLLDAQISRDEAFALLQAHNQEPFHIDHGQTVEGIMRYFAQIHDPENVEFWGLVGLLHDLDWEEFPTAEDHTLKAAEMLREVGASEDLIKAIQTHNADFNNACPKPELFMEKILFATDELSGLIGACVRMRPSGSVMDFEVKSLRKKFKNTKFAAGCDRGVITSGAEMLGWELDDLFEQTIQAMRSFAPDKDSFVVQA